MHQNGLSGMYLGFEMCQIQWHLFQVSTISNSWKIKISGKNFTFCWFWLGKMHHNGLSGMYLGFEVCQIQWHRFQVSMISGSWKIKISGKNFTFCWFWLGKMHQNGLSGTYLGFEVAKSNGTGFVLISGSKSNGTVYQVSTISHSCEIKIWGKIWLFVDFDLKNASQWLEWYIFRVQGMQNPMAQVSRLYNKQLLKNQNFSQKFHILLILTGKNASKWLEWCILGFETCQIQWHLFQVSMISGSWKIKMLGDK